MSALRVVPDDTSSWVPLDLAAAYDGGDIEPPTLLARVDGPRLLYARRVHQFAGESESCKSWAAVLAAAQTMADGGRVMWIDFEDDERGVVARFKALGASRDAIMTQLAYIRPDEPLRTKDGRLTGGYTDLVAINDAFQPTLVVIDGVTEAMVTEGLDLMSNADAAVWSRLLPKMLAVTAAVIVIDHLPKSVEGNRRFAIGAQHKLAGLTGAAYRFDVVRPLSRATDKEVTGTVTITVTKDRPGHVRAHAVEGRIGVLELTAWPDGGVTAVVLPPTVAVAPDLALCQRIAEYLTQYDGASKVRIETDVDGKTDTIRQALAWMAAPERLWVEVRKMGQSHRHYLTDEGRLALP